MSLYAAVVVLALSSGACRSTHGRSDMGSAPAVGIEFDRHLGKEQRRVAEEALSWLGTPYMYAGQEKGVGTDCSGMVMKVYEEVAGCRLPRNSAKQAEFCSPLSSDEVTVGDLVFFATGKDPGRVSHVGIMLDDVRFVHASSSKGVVVSDVTSPYYTRTFIMYGRVPSHLATY